MTNRGIGICSRLGVLVAITVPLANQAHAQLVPLLDFGSDPGKLSDANGSFTSTTAFAGGAFSLAYGADSVDFSGPVGAGENIGNTFTLTPANALALAGVNEAEQRLELDFTVGPANETGNLSVQLADTSSGTGYAYRFDISRLDPGDYKLYSPVLNQGNTDPLGDPNFSTFPLNYNTDTINQFSIFSGNTNGISDVPVDLSINSLGLFTPTPIAPEVIEFGPTPNQRATNNGLLTGIIDNRGGYFAESGNPQDSPTPALDVPTDAPGGLRFTGTVDAHSHNGRGVELLTVAP